MACPKNSISCQCKPKVTAVTLKGIDKSDGTTTWEYGPGSFWRHHYGADAISGLVPNLSATLDKYAIGAFIGNQYVNAGNRNTATLLPNVASPLTITKLDSLDGTVIEFAAIDGMFCDAVDGNSYTLSQGITITETAALSGGDYVIVGRRVPFIEFVDFSSNTLTKEYILHAHNQQAGNVYLKTRTSSEVIAIPFNSTAAAVEALFEATADCTAATATGGPWPHRAIEIDVTWSVSGGDIQGIAAQAVTPVTTFTTAYSTPADNIERLIFTPTAIGAGSTFTFTYGSSPAVFSFTSTTASIGTFLAELETAIEAFALAQGADGTWETIDVSISGSTLVVLYRQDVGPLVVAALGSSSNTSGIATTYNTGTGEISNSVGAIFGRAQSVTLTRLIASTTTIPTVFGAASAGIEYLVSGPDNSVVLTGSQFAGTVNVGQEKARTIEAWTVGTTWEALWKYYANPSPTGSLTILFALHVESGHACISFPRQSFAGGGTACAATIEIDGGAVTEYDNDVISSTATNLDNRARVFMHEDDPTTKIIGDYEQTFTDADYTAVKFQIHFEGSQVWSDGVQYLLGINPSFASQIVFADGAAVYSVLGPPISTINNDPAARNPAMIAGTNARGYLWTFYTTIRSRFGADTEFRFKFVASGAVTKYSSWLAWNATDADITTALLTVFPENTGGVASNVNVYPFGAPSTIVNPDASLLEQGLEILFAGAAGATNTESYIPPAYVSQRGSITVELQNVESYDTSGIAAFDPTDGSVNWTRPWGTADSATISSPQYMWIRGDFVYAYGQIVDSEF